MRYIVVGNMEVELTGPNFDYLEDMGVLTADGDFRTEHPAASIARVAISGNAESDVVTDKPHFSCVFVFHEGYVLLVKKNQPQWQNGRWNGVGGAHDEDEAAIDCAIREFREETGGTEPPELTEFCVLEDSDVVVHFFRGEAPADRPFIVDDSNDVSEELKWHSVASDDAVEWQDSTRSIENLSWLIPMARDRFHLQGMVTSLRRDENGDPVR